MVLLRFLFLVAVKLLSQTFYRFRVNWVGEKGDLNDSALRLGVLLNHTSLFEPLFIGCLPYRLLWRVAVEGAYPAADKTMNRPFAGAFYRILAPHTISITRKRDETWAAFVEVMRHDPLVIIAPEGRMKRRNGLDLCGEPMTVRGGVADIISLIDHGKLLFIYSGGLHHVQAPGEGLPRLFKRIDVNFEIVDMAHFKAVCARRGPDFRQAVIAEMEYRRDVHCPPPQVDDIAPVFNGLPDLD